MITGVGFTEILTVLVLVLLFFGSKELPAFVREAGRMLARLRRYGDQVRRELDDISHSVSPAGPEADSAGRDARSRKQHIRARLLNARAGLSDEQRGELSARIAEHAICLREITTARVAMLYLHTRSEVRTDELIARLRARGTRIVLPYAREVSRDLGIAEVHDEATQTAPGFGGIREPLAALHENFLKSDIGVVICPGVGFDRLGGRLGRGQGYYDNFLRELLGRVPFVGLAYSCQIVPEPFPFDYHDVSMTQVVCEQGAVIGATEAPLSQDNMSGA